MFETEDSGGEGILGAEGDVSDEESRLVGQFDQKFAKFYVTDWSVDWKVNGCFTISMVV